MMVFAMNRSIPPARARAARWAVLGAFVVAAAAVSVPAHAQHRHGQGMEGVGMMFGGGSGHMARHLDRMIDGLGVSDAQRTQIRQIAQAAAADLKAQRKTARGLRAQGLQIFTAPSVDAAAAESLRQQMLAQHDQASRRTLQAMLDVSQVLTPEQRAKLGERMKERQAVMSDRMKRMQREHHERPAEK
jgi:Spy/CpxP family protein refolding chaperone